MAGVIIIAQSVMFHFSFLDNEIFLRRHGQINVKYDIVCTLEDT